MLPRPQSPVERIAVFCHNWGEGKRHKIPVCCRAHFCLDRALGRVVSVVRWREIATWETPLVAKDAWVPCGVIHRGYSPFSASRRLARILWFNLAVCLPGDRAAWMRERAHACGPVWTALEDDERARVSRQGGRGRLWWARRIRAG